MSSHSDHDRWNLCRNSFTRSRWSIPLLLLFASPLTKGLAVSGTLMVGTGCAEPSYDECEQWRTECLRECSPADSACQQVCEADADACFEDAYAAQERRAETADDIADAAVACFAVAMCTLDALDESEGDGDGDGDDSEWPEDPVPAPDPEPTDNPPGDWGEDWGELTPDDELELSPEQLTDLPEE